MAPPLQIVLTFFGLPLVLGVLGLAHSVRLAREVYRRRDRRVPVDSDSEQAGVGNAHSQRELVIRAVGISLVSTALVAHSGRWLVSIYA